MNSYNLSLKSLGLLVFDYCEVPSDHSSKVLNNGPHTGYGFLLIRTLSFLSSKGKFYDH